MCNPQYFFQRSSQEYKDACDLWDLYIETRNDLIAEALGESSKAESAGRRRSMRKASTMDIEDEDEDDEKSNDTKVSSSIFSFSI